MRTARETRRPPTVSGRGGCRPRWLHAVVTRSSTIAMTTIAMPPFSASPTSSCFRPSSTWRPRPAAPTTAAITTIPRAIMIVWLTPSIIEGFASGSCTFASFCRDVDPKESATSSAVGETSRMPERGEPSRRRDGEDHRRDQRRRVADPEEQHGRQQVGVRRDRLHRVEDRPEAPLDPGPPAGPDARAACRSPGRRPPTRAPGPGSPRSRSHTPSTPNDRTPAAVSTAMRQPATRPARDAAPTSRPSQVIRDRASMTPSTAAVDPVADRDPGPW